ncbi:MAG TPA: sugar phosphate nucleotidyltransferase, partial [Acidimicrobiales bacterium]
AVVLAAGAGSRLAPLSERQPKALCPVGNRPLIDLALQRLAGVTDAVAVNLHHGAAEIRTHLEASGTLGRAVHVSHEESEALGTAGALGALRGWLDGRDVLVVNADTWAPGSLAGILLGWDRERPRVLVHGADDFGPSAAIAGCVLPWAEVARLAPVPSGLYEVVWGRRAEEGRLEVLRHDGPFVDCGTPADYLAANRAAASLAGGQIIDASAVLEGPVIGACVVGAGARVAGRIEDSVVWPGVHLPPGRDLHSEVAASPDLIVGPLPPSVWG